MNLIGKGITEALCEAAKDIAKRNDLVSDQGVIICWHCRDNDALLPSLHCARCLQAWRRAHGAEPHTVNVKQLVEST